MSRNDYMPEVGDIITVDGHHVGDVKKVGEVREVLGNHESPHYRILWEDDHESIFFPGSDAIIRPKRRSPQGSSAVGGGT